MKRAPIRRFSSGSVRSVIVAGLGLGVVTLPAMAWAHSTPLSEAFFKECAAVAGTVAVDRRIPTGRSTVNVHPRSPTGSASGCSGLTWVKASGPLLRMTLGLSGRTALTAWDCQHSTLSWGIYRKTGADWRWMGGAHSTGSMPNGDGTQCNYDKTGFPADQNWGTYSVGLLTTSSYEYRIAFQAWSHDDTGLGHNNYCADPVNCQWPVKLDIESMSVGWPVAKQDWSIWRPSDGNWFIADSTSGLYTTQQWGQNGDRPVSGDYDGDYKSDFAVARYGTQAQGINWFIINSSTGAWWQQQWGTTSDIPLVGSDFDGDGRSDVSIFRPSAREWHSVLSGTGAVFSRAQTGSALGDRPAIGDYDNDMRTDLVLWRPTSGRWKGVGSHRNTAIDTVWGVSTDTMITPDFDGDFKTDIAIWRPSSGVFMWIDSADSQSWLAQWGAYGDIPVPAHLDNDKKMDFMVYRGFNGRFYYVLSTTGANFWTQWGGPGDQPIVPFSRAP